jgi:signal transduction histidine kinase/ligand-binding sensor domain-containing protein/DNA-binding response OmpR family regulator
MKRVLPIQLALVLLAGLGIGWGTAAAQQTLSFEQFTRRDGLSSDYILSILQDQEGFIWIGTENGLNRFDGEHFLRYRFDPKDAETLDDNWVLTLFEDSRQQIWIGTKKGLHRLDRENGKIRRIPLWKEGKPVVNAVQAIREDPQGNLWIATLTGGLYRFTSDQNSEVAEHFAYGEPFVNNRESIRLFDLVDVNTKELWLLTSAGIDRLTFSTQEIDHYPFPAQDGLLAGDVGTYAAVDDGQGGLIVQKSSQFYRLDREKIHPRMQLLDIPIATDIEELRVTGRGGPKHQGKLLFSFARRLAFLDIERNELEYFRRQEGSATEELFSVDIHAVYWDRQGNCWVGTAGEGLYLGQSDQKAFTFYQHEQGNPASLSKGPVRTIVEDKEGRLWVGIINHGLDVFSLNKHGGLQKVQSPYINPRPAETAAINNVIKLIRGPEHSIWLASNTSGLLSMDSTGRPTTHYTHQSADPNAISGNRIWALTTDQQGYIWAGTWHNGLNRVDPESGEVVHFRHEATDSNSLISDEIRYLLCDEQGFLWIGTTDGVDRYDSRTGAFTHFQHQADESGSLSDNLVWSIYQDREQRIWVGTDVGLNRYDPATDQFEHFFESDGLPDHTIYGILEDDEGILWVSTENGLARQLPVEAGAPFFPLTLENELETVSFIPKAYWNSTRSSQLFFGSSDGLLVVDPALLKLDTPQPQFALHAVEVFNPFVEEVVRTTDYFPGRNSGPIRLGYQDQSITFSIADLNWKTNKKWYYQYQLVGFNRQWMPLPKDRQVSFSNLKPGRYQFEMRAVNAGNRYSPEVQLAQLIVSPPWWKAIWAYTLYVLVGALVIYLIFHSQLRRYLHKQEADNLRALDAFKNQLFTNITHEFRTPLTIIQGMIDQIEKKPERWVGEGTAMIRKNSDNLLDLVNQILELQKLESGKLTIKKQQGDIIPFLETILWQFQAYAQGKKLQLNFTTEVDQLTMDFDSEKTLRIVNNLLSNAIKYTPERGTVTCSVSVVQQAEDNRLRSLLLSVTDTGPGIPADELPHIFDRFFQVTGTYQDLGGGTGVGLSLTQGMVHLLDGQITVESTLGQGTTFRVFLPITQTAPLGPAMEDLAVKEAIFAKGATPQSEKAAGQDLPLVLIVEDNPDISHYLQICLEGHYRLAVAADGQEGIEQALATIPDLIISDVMMPRKNGFELCESLKEDIRTSHIPIILLTAKSDVASRIAGLKQGADDYLAKPFHQEELLVRMHNILTTRKKLQLRYQDLYNHPPTSAPDPLAEKEDAFILQLKEIIEERMDDPEFSLDALSQELHLSPSQVRRKIKALTGRSAAVYLRSFRLQKARFLLQSTSISVKEIAYKVGFSNPSYFSTCYTEEFGESPRKTRVSSLMRK